MFSLKSLLQSLPRLGAVSGSKLTFTPVTSCQPQVSRLSTSSVLQDDKVGSTWRLPRYEGKANSVWPNYIFHYTHHKHKRQQHWHTWGIFKQTKLNVVDNSALGRKAMAEGKPPRVIHVYSNKHKKKKNGTIGKLGDRVMVAILGQKKKGIIVGMKAKQLHAIPRYDSNNIVLIEDNGNPSGNRITAPLPNVIRPILQKDSNPKKADYTKLFAIATKWI